MTARAPHPVSALNDVELLRLDRAHFEEYVRQYPSRGVKPAQRGGPTAPEKR